MTVARRRAGHPCYGRRGGRSRVAEEVEIAGEVLLRDGSPGVLASVRPVFRQIELEAALATGETPLISGLGLFVVGGAALVHAIAGVIDACEDAEVFASGRASVRARDRARIWIEGEVHVDAYDSATVIARGACRVRAADRVRVWAQHDVIVTRQGRSVSVRRRRALRF